MIRVDEVFTKVPNYGVFKELFKNKDFISIDDLWATIEDMNWEIEHLEEQLHDLEQDLEDNYVPRKRSDYTGDSYDDMF